MNRKGFTLVELLVAISILAILTLIAIPTLRSFQSNNSKAKYLNYRKAIETSGKLYNNTYTVNINKKTYSIKATQTIKING